MKKRLICTLLMMIFTTLLLSTTAFADDCTCPGCHGTGNHASDWTDIATLSDTNGIIQIENAGNYYLSRDISSKIIIGKDDKIIEVSLCLNGHTIKTTSAGSVIRTGTNTLVKLYDNNTGTGTITSTSNTTEFGGGIYAGGPFMMYGGNITGCQVKQMGGGIYAAAAGYSGLSIYGGTISNNTAKAGGGVAAACDFWFEGGVISGNDASEGAGLYVMGDSHCQLRDGEIKDNVNLSTQWDAGYGGGVYAQLSSLGSFSLGSNVGDIKGTTISGNRARRGAGIYLNGSFDADLTTGEIKNNHANTSRTTDISTANQGGGVYATNGTDVTVSGNYAGTMNCIISGNTAVAPEGVTVSGNGTLGGGIVLDNKASLTIEKTAQITGNTAQTIAGGIYAFAGSKVYIKDAPVVDGNKLADGTEENIVFYKTNTGDRAATDTYVQVSGALTEGANVNLSNRFQTAGTRATGSVLVGAKSPAISFTDEILNYVHLDQDTSVLVYDGQWNTLLLQNEYTVNFYNNYDGADPEVHQEVAATPNAVITANVETPTRTDYVFDGWYKEATCTTAWNMTADTVTEDTNLYAKWLPAQTLAFGTDTPTTKTYGDATFTQTASKGVPDETTTITYQSSDDTIAAVDENTGAVTITGTGEVTITASVPKTTILSGATASYTVNVGNATITDTTPVSTQSQTVAYTGSAASFVAPTGTALGGQTVAVAYTSTQQSEVVGVNAYTIDYTLSAPHHDDKTGSITVTVEKADSEISTTTASATVTYGDSITLAASAHVAGQTGDVSDASTTATDDTLNKFTFTATPQGGGTAVVLGSCADVAETAGTTAEANLVYDTATKALTPGTYTITVAYSGSENLNSTTDTPITLTITPKTIANAAVVGTISQIYTGKTITFTNITLTSDEVLTADNVILKTEYATLTATAKDYPVSGTVVLSGTDKAFYTAADSVAITGNVTIAPKAVDGTQNFAHNVVAGSVMFPVPSFDGVNSETIIGDMVYTVSGTKYTTYDALIAYLNAQIPSSTSETIAVSYTLTASGNYTGTITGEIALTTWKLTFTDGLENTKTVTYGDTWGTILGFTQDTYATTLGETAVEGAYTLKIDGTAYDATAKPNANTTAYNWAVTFTANGDDRFVNVPVEIGTVTVNQRTAQYTWDKTTFDYDDNAHLPSPTITNAVAGDEVTITATGAQTAVGNYTATAVLGGADSANYVLPTTEADIAFTINAVETKGTVSFAVTDDNADEILNTGDTIRATYHVELAGGTPTYQWYKDDVAIVNANTQTYTLTADDTMGKLSCTVTFTGNTTGSVASEKIAIAAEKPEILTIATVAGNGKVTVNWTVDNKGSTITSYKLMVTYLKNDVTTLVANVPFVISGDKTSYTVSGLTNGVHYTFELTATNAMGDMASQAVIGTPVKPATATAPTTTIVPTPTPAPTQKPATTKPTASAKPEATAKPSKTPTPNATPAPVVGEDTTTGNDLTQATPTPEVEGTAGEATLTTGNTSTIMIGLIAALTVLIIAIFCIIIKNRSKNEAD